MTEDDIRDVTALVKQSGTSFYHGMKVLPAARRDAMYGIYAFCRVVDDITDADDAPFESKRAALDIWRDWVANLYTGQTSDAITRVLRAAVVRSPESEAVAAAVSSSRPRTNGNGPPVMRPQLMWPLPPPPSLPARRARARVAISSGSARRPSPASPPARSTPASITPPTSAKADACGLAAYMVVAF